MKTPTGRDADATEARRAQAGGDDPFRLAPWLKELPDVPLPPLMVHPMAAIAATTAIRAAGRPHRRGRVPRPHRPPTTAIGFGIAGQMAGAMLGVMQGAAERTRAALDEASAHEAKAGPARAAPVLSLVPKAPEPAAKPRKPVTGRKTKVARQSATPAAEANPVRKAPAAKTAGTDDLKVISGIGPKLEQVLNSMKLTRYADIAALTPADVERIDAELGLGGRIARDGWVEQAKVLGKGRG